MRQTSSAPAIPMNPPDADPRAGMAVYPSARFTVITPTCIRMEYCPHHGFIDAPTLFVSERGARDPQAAITRSETELVIETRCLRLVYRPDGQAFHAGNLEVTFAHGNHRRTWRPDSVEMDNLGGPIPTLDNVSGPVPLAPGLLSRDGWHLVDDSGTAILHDGWARQRPGGLPAGTILAERGDLVHLDLDWYLFAYGPDYKAALRSLSAISGAAAMPRRSILGSWYCRWHPYTSAEFRGIVAEYRENGFPLDIMVMDMDWHNQKDALTGYGEWTTLGWTGYTWNRPLLPDAEALLCDLKEDGLSVVLNDHPADGMREHEERYAEFMALLPPGTPPNPPFQAGNPLYMEAFFRTAHHPLEDQGVDFWWLDWQQDWLYPHVIGVPGLRHLPWLNHLYFQDSARRDRRGLGFSRWGGWGGQRYPIQFSGDTDSNWEVLEFLVPFSTASGNAGCFFWAHDTGGFRQDAGPENLTRWIQFSALSASLRVHSAIGGADRRPWLAGSPFAEANRAAYQLRSTLIPYLYSAVRECFEETVPLMRAMSIEHPDCEEAYRVPGQYLLGRDLLVAPITRPGVGPEFRVEKEVWFPEGNWHHFLTGEKMGEGGGFRTISAALHEIPIYVRAGMPIPLQPFTERMTTAPLSTLVVRCVAGGSGETTLYEDDGQTRGYLQGEHAKSILTYLEEGSTKQFRISAVEGTYAGQPATRVYRFELRTEQPLVARLDGAPVPVERSASGDYYIITLPALPVDRPVDLLLLPAVAD